MYKIYTSSFSKVKSGLYKGKVIGIVRNPLPYTHKIIHTNIRGLGPSDELRQRSLNINNYELFSNLYKDEILNSRPTVLKELKRYLTDSDITLCCYCDSNCHRFVLAEILKDVYDLDYDIEEIQ